MLATNLGVCFSVIAPVSRSLSYCASMPQLVPPELSRGWGPFLLSHPPGTRGLANSRAVINLVLLFSVSSPLLLRMHTRTQRFIQIIKGMHACKANHLTFGFVLCRDKGLHLPAPGRIIYIM